MNKDLCRFDYIVSAIEILRSTLNTCPMRGNPIQLMDRCIEHIENCKKITFADKTLQKSTYSNFISTALKNTQEAVNALDREYERVRSSLTNELSLLDDYVLSNEFYFSIKPLLLNSYKHKAKYRNTYDVKSYDQTIQTIKSEFIELIKNDEDKCIELLYIISKNRKNMSLLSSLNRCLIDSNKKINSLKSKLECIFKQETIS